MSHAGSHRGECKDSKMWQIEPDASLADSTMGLCIHHDLKAHDLRVSGNGGCDSFAAGQPARAEGAGAEPGEKG